MTVGTILCSLPLLVSGAECRRQLLAVLLFAVDLPLEASNRGGLASNLLLQGGIDAV